MTTKTVTDQQIIALMTEAGEHGDIEQVTLCRRALDGSKTARRECQRVIVAANAQTAYRVDN